MLFVCYSMLNSQKIYQSITVKKVWLLTYYDTSGIAKKAAEASQKKEQ